MCFSIWVLIKVCEMDNREVVGGAAVCEDRSRVIGLRPYFQESMMLHYTLSGTQGGSVSVVSCFPRRPLYALVITWLTLLLRSLSLAQVFLCVGHASW